MRSKFQKLTRSMWERVEELISRLEKPFARCGWDPAEGESPHCTSCRPLILGALCTVCEDEEVRREALRRYHALMKDGDGATDACFSPVDTLCHTEIRTLCMKEGVREGPESQVRKTVDELMTKYHETTGAEQRRILSAIGQAEYPSVLTSILDYALDGTVRKQDSYMVFACVMRNKKVSHEWAGET